MFQSNTDRTITQILLSLWGYSTRRVERLPKVRVYEPTDYVQIVKHPANLMHDLSVGHYCEAL